VNYLLHGDGMGPQYQQSSVSILGRASSYAHEWKAMWIRIPG